MTHFISDYFKTFFLFFICFILTDAYGQRRSSSSSSKSDTSSVRSSQSSRQGTTRNSSSRTRTSERTITSMTTNASQYVGSWTYESIFVADPIDVVEDDSTGLMIEVELQEVEENDEVDGYVVDEDADLGELDEMDFVLEIYDDGNAAFIYDTSLAIFSWSSDDEAIYFEVTDTSEIVDLTYGTDEDGDPIIYLATFDDPSCMDSTFIDDDEIDYEYDAYTSESCADSANGVWDPGGFAILTLVPAVQEYPTFADALADYEDVDGRSVTSARKKKKKKKRGGFGKAFKKVKKSVAKKAKRARPKKAIRKAGRKVRKNVRRAAKHTARFSKKVGNNALGWAGNAADAMGNLIEDAWKDAILRTALDANKKFKGSINAVPGVVDDFVNNTKFINAINSALSGNSSGRVASSGRTMHGMDEAVIQEMFVDLAEGSLRDLALGLRNNVKGLFIGAGGSVAAGFGAGKSVMFGISIEDLINKVKTPTVVMAYVENSFIGFSAGAGGEAVVAWTTDAPQGSSGMSIDFNAGVSAAVGVGTSCSIQMPTRKKIGGRFLGHSISVSPGSKFEVDVSVGMGCTRIVDFKRGEFHDCIIIIPKHIIEQLEQQNFIPGFKILDENFQKENDIYPGIILKG